MKKRMISLILGIGMLFALLPATVWGAEAGGGACAGDETCPLHAFTDADAAAWYHDGVHYCLENGLMGGCGNGVFAPEAPLSRAMLAQILYNLAGRPAVRVGADGAWYAGAMAWAASGGFVESDGRAPGEPVEREELALALWRYAKAAGRDVSVGEDTNILGYKDFTLISEEAIPAMQWTAGSGVMKGTEDGHLYPLSMVSRAEAASVLRQFQEP